MTAPAASPWSPLRQTTFRWLWLASIASNIGTWMHEVGAGWLMTSLSASPLNVALVQVAGSLPMFFLALPAGASPISSTSAATCSACNCGWPWWPPCWPASPCSS